MKLTEQLIREHLTPEAVRLWLTSPYGQRLRLWSDGHWDTESSGTFDASEWRTYRGGQDPEVVASIRLGNPGGAEWCATEWAHQDPENDYVWVEDTTGRVIGDDDALITEFLRDADLSRAEDSIVSSFLEVMDLQDQADLR